MTQQELENKVEQLAQESVRVQMNTIARENELEKRIEGLRKLFEDLKFLGERVKILEDVRLVQKSINAKLLNELEKNGILNKTPDKKSLFTWPWLKQKN